MKLVWTEPAVDSLQAIHDYIAEDIAFISKRWKYWPLFTAAEIYHGQDHVIWDNSASCKEETDRAPSNPGKGIDLERAGFPPEFIPYEKNREKGD
ncbi:MAG: hypothetical protein RQ824_07815 [bacterium]|nr:hypothetical protein [bacterium]